jgi:hypothetical protein
MQSIEGGERAGLTGLNPRQQIGLAYHVNRNCHRTIWVYIPVLNDPIDQRIHEIFN